MMQFVGCDVAKATLAVAAPVPSSPHPSQRPLQRTYDNQLRGWRALGTWLTRRYALPCEQIAVVVEATGVYHQPLVNYLYGQGLRVLLVNPGRATQYARSQNQLHKTDARDALSLQRYGVSLQPPRWYTPRSPQAQRLSVLLQRVRQLNKDRQRERNRLEKCAFIDRSAPVAGSIRRQLDFLEAELIQLERQITRLIRQHPALSRHEQLLRSIPGIGPKTARALLPVLHDQRFDNARQVAAFLGLTPCQRQSGSSLNAPARLSRRGNPATRAALYMAAVVATQHNPALRRFYLGLLERGKTKKQAIAAVMRKLVHIAFGVIKHQAEYDPSIAGCN